jgi:hypothetical protein
MKLINYSKVRRSAQSDLKKYERLGIKLFTAALKLQAKPNPSPLPMQEAYIKFYQTVFVESAKQEFNRIRQDNREKAYVPDDFFLNTWREWIKDWVLQNLGNLITGVNDNTLEQIQKILGEGIEQGLNPFQLERLLLEQIPNIARARAIARTESTRAYNEGKKRSAEDWAKQTGTTLWKLWIHGGSREPRFQHIQAQDKPIRADQPFVFTTKGVEVFMDKPGDQKGGAAQTINCSCVVVYISEAYARRNFPDTFNGSAPVIRPITPLPTTTNLNPPSVTNTQLKDELIYSTQDKAKNKKINDILSKSDGVNEMMNQNGSVLAIRTQAQSSREGALNLFRDLGYDDVLEQIAKSRSIGNDLGTANGNCARNGKFMNIKVFDDDVVEFRPVKLTLEKSEVNNLLNNGYAKAPKQNGVIPIYNKQNDEAIGFLDKNDDFIFWSVTDAHNFKFGKRNIAATITHESAHMMQALKDKNLSRWFNIVDRNNMSPQKDAITQYGKTNFDEFYAETYSAFVYDNNGLKTKNPKLYNIFVEYLAEIGVDINTIQIAK